MSHFSYRRMLHFFLILFFSSGLMLQTMAGVKEKFDKGNDLYRKGNFKEAETVYESLSKEGYHSSDLYLNLGNACYKQKNYAAAILNYEKALKENPSDEDAKFNLALANAWITDKIEAMPELFFSKAIRKMLQLFSANAWAKMSIVSIWLALIASIIFLFFSRDTFRRMTLLLGMLLVLFSIGFTVISNMRTNLDEKNRSGIIMMSSVYVKSAPEEGSNSLFLLHEGTKVQVLDNVGTWSKIRLTDGKTGWLEGTAYLEI